MKERFGTVTMKQTSLSTADVHLQCKPVHYIDQISLKSIPGNIAQSLNSMYTTTQFLQKASELFFSLIVILMYLPFM